ncbi:zinc finger protein basonuclin-2 isoform X3 [Pimephales promelas]|uniref:zinc finger protein basonuclin-2 isoform X3 n=1 Tax=Pimephales promelas TaxID=90988 RepID=UPI001955A6B1|nr:zinc finger protein basonuclin-2 isoform X3 [Pimephales promelas]KAG1926173.1 zinc finger protein basonuclin-1 [Pimephales promelas]
MSEAICCTLVNCNCDSFKPGKLRRRLCEDCRHGWVAHALSKLKVHHMYQGSQVEIVHSNVVFDICSLMLYGTQAIPVRLKILLDRLFSVLKQEEVIQILNALDWTLQDYIRGYVLQDVAGKVLDRWAIMTFEEEIVTLQQFLRFGETKSIVELMALQDKEGQAVVVPTTRTNSDIRSFIESSTQRSVRTPAKAEAPGCSNGHHFETLVNSMALMLPLQLLNSVPAPLLSSGTACSHQEAQTRREASELSLDGSAGFDTGPVRAELLLHTQSPKMETEEFNVSGNSSPSTPCTSSITSENTHMSPESKMRCAEKSGSLKKGRVFCSACEKTFYDKGTLKIHYNAVHLKIKHKCTIEGCNMVFSSLRSRNRHSANPNPRLHMPMNRNNRDKDLRGGLSPSQEDEPEGEKREFASMPESRTASSFIIRNSEPKLHGSLSSMSQSGILFPNLKTVQPVLPFYRSLVTPAELAHTPGNLPSLPLLSSSVPVSTGHIHIHSDTEPAPKKKSRKSSMPIKIEKDDLAEEGVSEEETPPLSPCAHTHKCDISSEGRGLVDRDGLPRSTANSLDAEWDKLTQEESCIISPSSPSLFHTKQNDEKEKESSKCEEPTCSSGPDQPCSHRPARFTHGSERCADGGGSDPENTSPDDKEEQSHPCEICSKTFKNPYSVKMHYRNVHLKEMHMCTVDGCNAAFPSRRSRDRHSANLNLHHRLLTKDYSGTSSLRREHPDLPHKEQMSVSQMSVILKASHRTGLVFPMSKSLERATEPAEGAVENDAVLDLSTRGSAHSSWDSDVGSEEGLPLEDSDESCDGLRVSSPPCLSLQSHSSSPITCHLCQKVYSNKGTFRAHYKTVHLRLLHKCKVPGCDTTFSSVRSRNRHSQNPNLHRNLVMNTSLNQE